MAGTGFVYSQAQLVEWVPADNVRLYEQVQLVEWVLAPEVRLFEQAQLVEWALPTKAQEQNLLQLVEWETKPGRFVLTLVDLVEWEQGNTMYVEPANIHIEPGFAPIMAVIYDAGQGLEVKEEMRYQLLDSENSSEIEPSMPDPTTETFEGNPLPGGIVLPPGTGFGAEAKYNEQDGPPVVGPDLVD